MLAVCIGAGIVGLHAARLLLERGYEVFVLDQAPYLAEHTSGRNSGVIHSGIFYEPGSIKEKLCIEGNAKTYEWVKKLGVNYLKCGKWVVPEPGQENDVEPFFDRISRLPIPKPVRVSATALAVREPTLRPSEAIFVPSTGLVDAAGYVKALARYIEERGAQIILNCKVTGFEKEILQTTRGEMPADLYINSAGLFADEIAAASGLTGYSIRPCRGDYYVLNKSPLQHPVYHLPYRSAHGLGVHLTPTLDGNTLVGPNAFFIDHKTDYRHRSAIDEFEKAVQFYLPHWPHASLTPGYCGNRPKLFFQEKPVKEFAIIKKNNWIHLLGIESPGLTAAPALAELMNIGS